MRLFSGLICVLFLLTMFLCFPGIQATRSTVTVPTNNAKTSLLFCDLSNSTDSVFTQDDWLQFSIGVEKTVYTFGEPVPITLEIINTSNQSQSFELSAFMFDFFVYNSTGTLFYRWSYGRVFPMWIMSSVLQPGENTTTTLDWSQTSNVVSAEITEGTYYIVGQLNEYGLQTPPLKVVVGQLLSIDTSKTVVARGCSVPLNFTVVNYGNFSETVNVTVSNNVTVIRSETNIDVPNDTPSTISFMWNTQNSDYGTYNVQATAGNLTVSKVITLTMPGDIDGDSHVGIKDLVLLANAYGTTPADVVTTGRHLWNSNADINDNGVVGLSDLVLLAIHYGQHWP